MSRKPKITQQSIEEAFKLARAGFTDKNIMEAISVSKPTFYGNTNLLNSIKEARRELRQKLSQSLLTNATDLNNPTVQIFLAKRMRLFDDTFDSISIKKSDDVLVVIADIFKAVSENKISEDKSRQLQSILETYMKAYEIHELESRIQKLEES